MFFFPKTIFWKILINASTWILLKTRIGWSGFLPLYGKRPRGNNKLWHKFGRTTFCVKTLCNIFDNTVWLFYRIFIHSLTFNHITNYWWRNIVYKRCVPCSISTVSRKVRNRKTTVKHHLNPSKKKEMLGDSKHTRVGYNSYSTTNRH